MDSLLYQIITENFDLHNTCYDQLRAMPEYVVTNARYQYACQQMNDMKNRADYDLFLDYESAANAMGALSEYAAVMVGFRLCLGLLTKRFC